jgi:hypothetical protein
MFTAAYTTDFYRAVRNALHAEVDSWREHNGSHTTRTDIDTLWREVCDLEPVSRNQSAFAPSAQNALGASSVFVPIEQLAPIRES